MDKHSCVLSIDIVPVVMEIIQLDNNDGACDTTSEWYFCAQDHYQGVISLQNKIHHGKMFM
jgi:hypothetical protein